MKIQKFQYKAIKVNIDNITFDSKLEASMYKILRKYKNILEIKVHNRIHTGWSVDFDLVPKNKEGVLLLDKLNCITGIKYPSRILIEVKGITDKNFISRYKQILCTPIERMLILVSSECNAIGYLDPSVGSSRIITKPIVPISMIRDILAR